MLVLLALENVADRVVALTRSYDSFPSGHAVSSMALAFAVALIG